MYITIGFGSFSCVCSDQGYLLVGSLNNKGICWW